MTDYLRNKPHHPLMAILIMSLLGQGSKSGYLSNDNKADCNLGNSLKLNVSQLSFNRNDLIVCAYQLN